MSTTNGNNDKKDEFQGATGEGNGSAGSEPKPTNSLVLYNNNLIIQMNQQSPQQDPVYSRAHQVAAQAAAAAAQASQVPTVTNLATEGKQTAKNGNRSLLKPNLTARPRRILPQIGRKSAAMTPRTSVPPKKEQPEKPDPYSIAALMEEVQQSSGSVARTMALSRGSWGKGLKRRAPREMEEDDGLSGEKLNITQKLKHGDLSNQDVDVMGGSKVKDSEEVKDLNKGAKKAQASEAKLLHKLLTNDKPEEIKVKVNPTATAAVEEEMPPVVESIHKKFEYKRWSAGVRAKSKQGLVQGPNLAAGPSTGPSAALGSANESFTAPVPLNESSAAPGSLNGPFNALEPAFGSYTAPGLATVNGAQTAIKAISSPTSLARPPIEAYVVPGPEHGAQNAVGYFSGLQDSAGITTESYFGAGSVNGLQNAGCSLSGTQYASELVNSTYIGGGEVDSATAGESVGAPSIASGTLRELLSAKKPFQNPYDVVVPVSKGPTPSTSTSSTSTATGPNGRSVIQQPEKLQRMLGELVLSPYITETQAIARLKTLGTTQNVQAEIDRFAAIISCGNAFAANRANVQQQQQQQQAQQKRQEIATSMTAAARDLIQAKHRESVIKGVPKK